LSSQLALHFVFSFVSKEIDRQFRAIVNSVVEDREKNGTRRDDLLQVIMDLREKFDKFTEHTIPGHSMTFLVGFHRQPIPVCLML
jgi:cytochrome P450